MTVGRICSRTTHLADPTESACVAAERMKSTNVGTLIVTDPECHPVGILTDRDLAVRVVGQGLDGQNTPVREIMTAHPRWVSEETPIEDAVAIMRKMGVRRLPVVDEKEHLVGLLSVDDVLELVTEELGNLGRIVGWSQPGINLPATRPIHRRQPAVATSGLERSSSDLEC